MASELQELSGEVNFSQLFDFGKDAFGTLEVELEGVFAENTEIVIGEEVRDGRLRHTPGFKTFLQHIFQLKNGHHLYRFPIPTHIPAYHGFPHEKAPAEADGEVTPFRYVEINRYHGKALLRRRAFFGDWNDQASAFACDNPSLQQVWDFCKYSIKATSLFSHYVDGERERMPYEGDAYINQLGHFCCDANYALAKRTIDHFMHNGQFTWPTEWLLLTPLLVRDYLLYSGDKAAVQEWLPYLEEKLLGRFMTADGLLSPASFEQFNSNFLFSDGRITASKIRDIVDWPKTERDGYDQRQVNFVPNAYLYAALKAMQELTGGDDFTRRAEALRTAIRTHFLRGKLFVDAIGSEHTALHTAIFALNFGLADGAEIAAHKELVLSKGMDCSVYGAQFLLDACFQHDMAEHALALLASDGPRSWQNMMREGATIAMESWGDRWKPNQDWNHPWGAAPANIIHRRLCGIRPTAPGFAEFVVEPHPATLRSFYCIQPTIHGPISLQYEAGKGYELQVPEGTTAIFRGQRLAQGRHSI